MFYAELDENNICFHVTESKLPLSERVVVADKNVLGMIYDPETGEFSEYIPPEPEPTPDPEPTQLDRIEEQLNALAADSVTVEKLEAAITEGVNEV